MFGTVWLTSEEWTDLFGEEAQKNELISSGAEERGQIWFFFLMACMTWKTEKQRVCVWTASLRTADTDLVFDWRVCRWIDPTPHLRVTQKSNATLSLMHCERETEKKMNVSVIIIHGVTDNNRCFIEMLFWLFRCLTGHCENISPDTHSEIMW